MNNKDNQVAQKDTQEPGHLERTRTRPVFAPHVDIKESEGELTVYADIPGVPEEKVDIMVEKGILTIRAEVPDPKEVNRGFSRMVEEYATGDYERAFALSDEVDQDGIRASVRNGVLEIHLPKAGPAKARKIEIAGD